MVFLRIDFVFIFKFSYNGIKWFTLKGGGILQYVPIAILANKIFHYIEFKILQNMLINTIHLFLKKKNRIHFVTYIWQNHHNSIFPSQPSSCFVLFFPEKNEWLLIFFKSYTLKGWEIYSFYVIRETGSVNITTPPYRTGLL